MSVPITGGDRHKTEKASSGEANRLAATVQLAREILASLSPSDESPESVRLAEAVVVLVEQGEQAAELLEQAEVDMERKVDAELRGQIESLHAQVGANVRDAEKWESRAKVASKRVAVLEAERDESKKAKSAAVDAANHWHHRAEFAEVRVKKLREALETITRDATTLGDAIKIALDARAVLRSADAGAGEWHTPGCAASPPLTGSGPLDAPGECDCGFAGAAGSSGGTTRKDGDGNA